MSAIDKQHPLIVCRASAGTGKTFTLAAYYIAMLLSGESYRNILAVTFTNAATAEMKERILTYLLGISQGGEKEFLSKVKEFMIRQEDVSDEVLQSRAQANLYAILQDYDNFSVTTIDSFLQQLIRGMAKAINRTADFAINLDAEQVITAAVDMMLTSELADSSSTAYCGLSAENRRTIYEYVKQCISESKNWDIRENLIRIALQLYKESVQVHQMAADAGRQAAVSGLDLDTRRITEYRKALYAKRTAALEQFKPLAVQAKNDLDAKVPYTKGRDARSAIDNMYKSATDPKSMDNDKLFRGATDNGRETIMAEPQLRALQEACDEMRLVYWQTTCSLTYLNDMRLMRALDDCIQRSLIRTNTALLADTAITLAEALQPGDADFILEKAGIRYRHIMMDEFQDTSLLQWSVFLHLIQELVAVPEQTILIVGDTKQSIYRFRNGNWQIMEGLGKTQLTHAFNPKTQPLIRNQRSREHVVAFNLGVMQYVAQQPNLQIPVSTDDNRPIGQALYGELSIAAANGGQMPNISDFYRTDKHPGGYVRCRFYPYYEKRTATKLGVEQLVRNMQQQTLWADICGTIEQLLGQGERPQDILVLARFNNEIQQWVNFCREQGDKYPLLNRTPMVSRDSFRLESCTIVLLLIEALRYMHTGSQAAAEFIRLHRGNDVIESIGLIDKFEPLYACAQHLLQLIGCEQGYYQGDDVAYVNCFMDQLQAFIATYGSDVATLLQYWDDTMHEASISGDSSSDAIRLMTIHSSKGLEGKTVILLDAGWYTEHDRHDDILWSESIRVSGCSLPYIPVSQNTKLCLTGDKSPYYLAYKSEHEAQLIDNYNLLYVALTRAADNLFVFALIDAVKHAEGFPTVAASLLDYTHLRGALSAFAESGQTCLDFSVGTEPHINQAKSHGGAGLFDYMNAESVSAQIYSDGSLLYFRQSQESTQYMLDAANADSQTAQTDFGLLCHDIFAHIVRADEARQVIDSYRQQGLIDNDEQFAQINELIHSAFANPLMQHWFDGSWQLMREAAILSPTAVIRPDRVMIKGDHAIVLDYKFTNIQRPGYIYQVRDYMTALKKMGYKHVEGWLWYAFPNQLIQVTQ